MLWQPFYIHFFFLKYLAPIYGLVQKRFQFEMYGLWVVWLFDLVLYCRHELGYLWYVAVHNYVPHSVGLAVDEYHRGIKLRREAVFFLQFYPRVGCFCVKNVDYCGGVGRVAVGVERAGPVAQVFNAEFSIHFYIALNIRMEITVVGVFVIVVIIAMVLAAIIMYANKGGGSSGYAEKKYPNGWVSSKNAAGYCVGSVLGTNCVLASLAEAEKLCSETPSCLGIWARSSWFDASNKTYYMLSISNEVEDQPTATNATYYQKL
jgi:hypothetical protein